MVVFNKTYLQCLSKEADSETLDFAQDLSLSVPEIELSNLKNLKILFATQRNYSVLEKFNFIRQIGKCSCKVESY